MNINLNTVKFAVISHCLHLYTKITGHVIFPVMYHNCSNCEVNIVMVSYYTDINKYFGYSITRWTHDKSFVNAKAQYNKVHSSFSHLFIKGSDISECPRCYGLKHQGIHGVSNNVHKSNSN